jgi:hypothetical protein
VSADGSTPAPPKVRTAHDARDVAALKADPSDADAKLEVALDETFPNSDPPANVQPGKGLDPAPSSGYDPDAEAEAQPS